MASEYFIDYSNIEDVLSFYEKSKCVEEISANVLNDNKNLIFNNCAGSLKAIVLASLFKKLTMPLFIIRESEEDAQNFYADLICFLSSEDVLLFPHTYHFALDTVEQLRDNVQNRFQALQSIYGDQRKIYISYPKSLVEGCIDKRQVNEASISIEVGQQLEIDFLKEILFEFNFDLVDFVIQPGHFSIRGGIIDVFTFGSSNPYRLELFDDIIESIRIFDPLSQLSIRKISSLNIYPNILNSGSDTYRMGSVFDVLNSQTLLVGDSLTGIIESLQYESKRIKESIDKSATEHLDFSFHVVTPNSDFGKQFKTLMSTGDGDVFLQLHSEEAPVFNKSFDLLEKNILSLTDKKYKVYICSENKLQLNRLWSIYKDQGKDLNYNSVLGYIQQGFVDHQNKIAVYSDHQIFNRPSKSFSKRSLSIDTAKFLAELNDLKPGDFVTHLDHGIGKYSGLEKLEINGKTQEMVRLIYADNDVLYVSIQSLHKISKYSGKENIQPKVHKLGSEVWTNVKNRTKAKIKDIADDLIKLYATRKAKKGFAFSQDNYFQLELEASFPHEVTIDQAKAILDVKADMESPTPMDRLICGDVGFGKTEIAIRAAFKAVCDNKQAVVLVPTTILASQHYLSFKERLDQFGLNIEFVNRFISNKKKQEIVDGIKNGNVQIVIGTHSIVSKQFKYKDLGLIVIDEEQKFGVTVKEKLRQLREEVDTLALTATPIPRTLQFSLMGARDLSILATPPVDRLPVHTELMHFNSEKIRDAIDYEVERGGQVFFVHNRVTDIVEVELLVKKLCPKVTVGIAHGQLESHTLEDVMKSFIDGDIDVLVSTNIIESGLNVPNANTMIIHNAHMYGLSDLHQLRGRVGRSERKAFCFLITPNFSTLTNDARRRLKTIQEFNALGSGFQIAMRDLDIRGAGNILGAEQSGFIADIGYETYHKILDEAMKELRFEKYQDLFSDNSEKYMSDSSVNCQLEVEEEMLIPDSYVKSTEERMRIYTKLSSVRNEEELTNYLQELQDKFGKLPNQMDNITDGIKLQWSAKKFGISRITLSKGKMKLYFMSNDQSMSHKSSMFGEFIAIVNQEKGLSLKQSNEQLIVTKEGIQGVKAAILFFERILSLCSNNLLAT